MTGPTPDPVTPLNWVTENNNQNNSPSFQDQILSHISLLETLVRQHNERAKTSITPIRLTFTEEGEGSKGKNDNQGLEMREAKISRGHTRSQRVVRSHAQRLDRQLDRPSRKVCPEKEMKQGPNREMGYIQGVPEVMQISAFMSNSKCPELARHFAYQVPQMVTEMMKTVDDFFKSKEVIRAPNCRRVKTPRRVKEHRIREIDRLARVIKVEIQGRITTVGGIITNHMFLREHTTGVMITESTITDGTLKKENLEKYYDYHGEKGHYNNDYYQLKRQLEAALESRKLSHLIKDVRKSINNRGRCGRLSSLKGFCRSGRRDPETKKEDEMVRFLERET
nr:reverse transcriptase domain-containing protein [Tanacetum cinerariifolium]